MGFGELCEGQFDGYVVGGGHNDLLDNPVTAKIVRNHFDQLKNKQEQRK